ncbi:hypothetical protein PROFUN_13761 [Planoprotostelium fungivorum]|uniref:Uncharacterized protein n=1 Tax=Planoprotostelium fungivorum TaxID=1890364 RepID=A0A2P6N325_9EUKA|nr:hypothetical protein PROFUN_13761 [Planoprotostelium fungivorum]
MEIWLHSNLSIWFIERLRLNQLIDNQYFHSSTIYKQPSHPNTPLSRVLVLPPSAAFYKLVPRPTIRSVLRFHPESPFE